MRVELKDINPPQDVQQTMNKVIKAENEKRSAIDFATAKETEADGFRRAKIKEAEGEKERKRLQGEGIAQEREAIARGLKESVEIMKGATGQNSHEILATLSLTQYLDTLKSIGVTENTKVLFLDTNVEKTSNLLQQLISSQEVK